MSHARYRRLGTMVAAGAIALSAGAVGANAASAYPTPAGAATSSCTNTNQAVELGSTPTNIACVFTFTNYKGAAATNEPVSFTTTGGTLSAASDTTSTNGAARTALSIPTCSTVGTTNYTITAALDSADANTQTQGFASVTCGLVHATVTGAGCVSTPSAFTGFDEFICSFTTTGVPDQTAVSYSVSDPDNAFTFRGSKSTKNGGFSTPVFVSSGDTSVTLTGFAAQTSTSYSASATQNLP